MRRLVLFLVILLMTVMLCRADVNAEPAHYLSFDDNQQFKILIVADTQDTAQPQQAMLTLLNSALDVADPDLVVFLGDMIQGPDTQGVENVKKAIDAIIQPVVKREIPFALVFGNHDYESGLTNAEQLLIYQSYPGCLAVEGEKMPGAGNYSLLIENPLIPESPLILWFLDSGTYAEPGRGKYGYVTEEQNEWMLQANDEFLTRYKSPVSYVFQHIPVPQVYEMLDEVPFGTKGAVTSYGSDFLKKWYTPNPDYIWAGNLGEGPCSSEYDSGEFSAWKSMGVKAAFFGHDHLNDYCGTVEGIDLITTSGIGFYMYGRGNEHGARLLTLYADRPSEYDTKMLYYRDIVSEPLPGLFVPWLGVLLQKRLLIGAGLLLLLVVLLILVISLIRKIRKKRRRKKKSSINKINNSEEKDTEVFSLFQKQKALVTAGNMEHFNSCTIGWGSSGTLWTRPGKTGAVLTVYLHPARYTHEFLMKNETFTVSFFPSSCKEALGYMGSHSGRAGNKAEAAGLTPVAMGDSVTYEEANLTFLCRKIYQHGFAREDIATDVQEYYKANPKSFPVDENGEWQPHWVFVGEILEIEDKR
ncbi:MAG: metallophosphoesterase [Saccharofermentanales bacterium]|jgi:flavin reductase (DIM6/NTAB) family NADH-FMN oxidoreductase RutF